MNKLQANRGQNFNEKYIVQNKSLHRFSMSEKDEVNNGNTYRLLYSDWITLKIKNRKTKINQHKKD